MLMTGCKQMYKDPTRVCQALSLCSATRFSKSKLEMPRDPKNSCLSGKACAAPEQPTPVCKSTTDPSHNPDNSLRVATPTKKLCRKRETNLKCLHLNRPVRCLGKCLLRFKIIAAKPDSTAFS